jgi:excisionase family DNA binding protein
MATGWVTVKEAAGRIGCSTRTVLRLVRDGRIRKEAVNPHAFLVNVDDVEREAGLPPARMGRPRAYGRMTRRRPSIVDVKLAELRGIVEQVELWVAWVKRVGLWRYDAAEKHQTLTIRADLFDVLLTVLGEETQDPIAMGWVGRDGRP